MPTEREVTELPGWIKDLERPKCEVIGDLVVCVSGTDKYPTYAGFVTGKYASYAEVCVGRVDREEDYWCMKVLADVTRVGKEHLGMIAEQDSIQEILDYRGNLLLVFDRHNRDKLVWELQVDGKIRMRATGPGHGQIEQRRWIVY